MEFTGVIVELKGMTSYGQTAKDLRIAIGFKELFSPNVLKLHFCSRIPIIES